MIFYSSNSVGFTSQVLLSGWANMYILIKNSVLVMNAILIVPSAAYICRRTAFLPCFSSARFSPAQGLISKRLAARK
ncbi:hypothetical protein BM734_13755 [Bacillus velezensis]|nr:hypothetical protein [Bacillus amyloliquefaciens]ODB67696.1 hypothetical protein A7313_08390 [Bacillus velezensis]OOI01108.1 hypothetical protein BM734_13755 [Bacillus velezensis]